MADDSPATSVADWATSFISGDYVINYVAQSSPFLGEKDARGGEKNKFCFNSF